MRYFRNVNDAFPHVTEIQKFNKTAVIPCRKQTTMAVYFQNTQYIIHQGKNDVYHGIVTHSHFPSCQIPDNFATDHSSFLFNSVC